MTAPGVPVTSLKGFQATFAGSDLYVATGDTLFRLAAGGTAKVVASLPSAATFLETDAAGGVWIGLIGPAAPDSAWPTDEGTASERRPGQA